jgi:ADP-heptose:LPS heptosyltransferase
MAAAMPSDVPPPPIEAVRTIGCLMLNGVGDIVCVTPALEALSERFPEARISAMVRPHLCALVRHLPSVHDVIPFGSGSVATRLAFLREIRRRRFDLWIDFHTPTFNTVGSNTRHFLRNAFLMRWSGARFRRAYASRPLARHLTHPLPVPGREALRDMNVARLTLALSWPDPSRDYRKRIPVTVDDRAWAQSALVQAPAPRVGLYFGTRQPANIWPEEYSLDLARRLLERRPSVSLVLVGDHTDAGRASRLLAGLAPEQRARVSDLTGRSSFGQTAALLEQLDVLVSSDSGPMHIADAMEVPIVALFSTHNYPGIWAPVNGRSVVIYHEIECGPCWRPTCPVGNRCMSNITPAEVFAAVNQKLADA